MRPVLEAVGSRTVWLDEVGHFPLEAAAKDAGLIVDTARAAGLHLGIAEVVRERLHRAADDGLGRADVAATYRMSRRSAS
ncbi:hypothetical protein [Streptomyces olivochromogenes]|uniref:Uncharacterized protein n=1 Tax=Streptomyces olivochromogenes TaxID=1963 RepID=A0A286PH24_STROL|nr:hypothetical protein [Streptomyces olivochromogenes]KUN34632.1 hypothetical protein AQJ27_49210 [Streptomyces olivochromogenes]GAX58853.1 hypothetical protein SO3561_10428 [Streptomyces olivochromogenes]